MGNHTMRSRRRYTLRGVDGTTEIITLYEFVAANRGMIGTGEIGEIAWMAIGQRYVGGGGAAPTWSLERVS
jgi:hypothetical protein